MKLNKTFGIFAAALMILFAGANLATAQDPCPPAVWNLWAGQTTDVGSITVWNDETNIYVQYLLDFGGATFGTLHLWVGTDLANMKVAGNGAPIPGQFPYVISAAGLTSYTFVIPIENLNLTGSPCEESFYVVPHAEVNGVSSGTETAFGGCSGVNIADPGRWWYYCTSTICCNGDGNGDGCWCETAFAYGCYIFASNPKANPDGLPTLGLTNNRWGWVTHFWEPGTKTRLLWAGAGLNKTANATLVGYMDITWNGAYVEVCYHIYEGFVLKEAHLYAGDLPPTTVAPGQYGNTAYFYPNGTDEHCFNVAVSDSDTDGIWLIIHGVVCRD
jgi:hypothetical protein